mgnify:CR=1 FL=1
MEPTISTHWENIYTTKQAHEVSWTQAIPALSLAIIKAANLDKNAKIIDIIGEGDFFTNYNTNIWNNQNPITSVTGGVEPKIEIHNTDPYIEDLSLVSNL